MFSSVKHTHKKRTNVEIYDRVLQNHERTTVKSTDMDCMHVSVQCHKEPKLPVKDKRILKHSNCNLPVIQILLSAPKTPPAHPPKKIFNSWYILYFLMNRLSQFFFFQISESTLAIENPYRTLTSILYIYFICVSFFQSKRFSAPCCQTPCCWWSSSKYNFLPFGFPPSSQSRTSWADLKLHISSGKGRSHLAQQRTCFARRHTFPD